MLPLPLKRSVSCCDPVDLGRSLFSRLHPSDTVDGPLVSPAGKVDAEHVPIAHPIRVSRKEIQMIYIFLPRRVTLKYFACQLISLMEQSVAEEHGLLLI